MPQFNYDPKKKQPFSNTAEGNVVSNAGLMYPKGSKGGSKEDKKNMLKNAFKKIASKSK